MTSLFNLLGGSPQTSGSWVFTSTTATNPNRFGWRVANGSWNWIPGPNANTCGTITAPVNLTGSHDIEVDMSKARPGDYVFTYTVAVQGCSNSSATVTITVNDGLCGINIDNPTAVAPCSTTNTSWSNTVSWDVEGCSACSPFTYLGQDHNETFSIQDVFMSDTSTPSANSNNWQTLQATYASLMTNPRAAGGNTFISVDPDNDNTCPPSGQTNTAAKYNTNYIRYYRVEAFQLDNPVCTSSQNRIEEISSTKVPGVVTAGQLVPDFEICLPGPQNYIIALSNLIVPGTATIPNPVTKVVSQQGSRFRWKETNGSTIVVWDRQDYCHGNTNISVNVTADGQVRTLRFCAELKMVAAHGFDCEDCEEVNITFRFQPSNSTTQTGHCI